MLRRYCYDCHDAGKRKGGLSLEAFPDLDSGRKEREVWAEILRTVKSREMPPEGKPPPQELERGLLTSWIQAELFPVDCSRPDPGRVTIRRLNRAEYNNTVRDLLGVDFEPADEFPADDTGYGFDNIGDVLSVSPLLLEKYLAPAEKLVNSPEGQRRILICHPEHGTTKTRLIPVLGPEGAAALQRRLTDRVAQTARRLMRTRNVAVDIRHAGGCAALLRQWLGEGFDYRPQGEGHLGQRMARCLSEV